VRGSILSTTFRVESPTYHIGITGLLSRKAFSSFLKKEGLSVTPEQVGILNILKENGIISMQELSQFSFRDNSAITRIVDNLEKNKLVQRKRLKTDRRKIEILITVLGQQILEQANEVGKKYVAAVTSGLTSAEIQQMISIMSKIKYNIENVL
jgi:DNA-binding MarR family transcriptional regulator